MPQPDLPRCLKCGTSLTYRGHGRPQKFCSKGCRQTSHRAHTRAKKKLAQAEQVQEDAAKQAQELTHAAAAVVAAAATQPVSPQWGAALLDAAEELQRRAAHFVMLASNHIDLMKAHQENLSIAHGPPPQSQTDGNSAPPPKPSP